MKKHFIILTAFLFLDAIVAKGQNVNELISKRFTTYSQLVIDKKINEALDYTIDDFFKIIPREQLATLVSQTMNSKEFSYSATLPTLTEFEKPKLINSKYYVRFKSNAELSIKFNGSRIDTSKTEEQKKLDRTLLKVAFETQFGPENVTFDEGTGTYKLKTKKNVIAASDENQQNWKFVVIENDRQKKILERFIPLELLN